MRLSRVAVPSMETQSDLSETGLSTEEIPSVDPGPVDELAEFEHKVTALVNMMHEDPEVRDRIIAETYVNIANTELHFRRIMAMMQEQGLGSMMRGMFKRGKDNG